MQEFLTYVQFQIWTNGGMLSVPLSLRPILAERLVLMPDPGHLVLVQITQHLALL